MKRILSLITGLALTLALTACGPGESKAASSTPAADHSASASFETDGTDEAGKATANILVAYFSRTGNTESLAEYAADILNADLYAIKPQIPYANEDLNYNDPFSRSVKEQNDTAARPAISGQVENMAQYDTVILAYPIWLGQAPRIIATFLERYDFSGKTIVPFCTSGSSGIGSSDTDLHELCPESTEWKAGRRFAAGTSKEALAEWLNSLEIAVGTPANTSASAFGLDDGKNGKTRPF